MRAATVDLDRGKIPEGKRQNYLDYSPAIVASGDVSFSPWRSHVIVAGGSVELKESDLPISDTIIISGGDVTLGCDLTNSVIIARGQIASKASLECTRIISGKSVITNKDAIRDCVISANDSNPLGFIRWAEVSKDKAPAKRK